MPGRDIHKVRKHNISILSMVIKGVRIKQKSKSTLHLNREGKQHEIHIIKKNCDKVTKPEMETTLIWTLIFGPKFV
jgi:hypothetical protein